MLKLDLEKSEEPEIKLPTSVGSSKKQERPRKISSSALLTMPKPLTMWSEEVKLLSCVQLFATSWTVAYQAPPMGFSRQEWILQWVAITFSRGSSPPRDRTQVSLIVGRYFTIWATREVFDYSLWLCGPQQTGKFWKRREYQKTWPTSWEICMPVRKQQLELDMEQQTGSN